MRGHVGGESRAEEYQEHPRRPAEGAGDGLIHLQKTLAQAQGDPFFPQGESLYLRQPQAALIRSDAAGGQKVGHNLSLPGRIYETGGNIL